MLCAERREAAGTGGGLAPEGEAVVDGVPEAPPSGLLPLPLGLSAGGEPAADVLGVTPSLPCP